MFFWYLGGTVALTRYIFRDEQMDLRLLMVGAILPDLVDTSLGVLVYRTFGAVRLMAHSLLFAALVMTLVLLSTGRGSLRRRWMPVVIGLFMHLLLDAVWGNFETLWWPFMGLSFPVVPVSDLSFHPVGALGDWKVWAVNTVGFFYLVVLAGRGGLVRSTVRRRFLRTGQIGVPIGR